MLARSVGVVTEVGFGSVESLAVSVEGGVDRGFDRSVHGVIAIDAAVGVDLDLHRHFRFGCLDSRLGRRWMAGATVQGTAWSLTMAEVVAFDLSGSGRRRPAGGGPLRGG
jgi:hypothetical protein